LALSTTWNGRPSRQGLKEAALNHPDGIDAREPQRAEIQTPRKSSVALLSAATGLLLLSGAILLNESAAAPADSTHRDRKGPQEARTAAKRDAPQHAAAPGTTGSPFVGRYEGKVEGGSGSMTIQARAGGRVHVDIIVGSPDCSGSIAFEATPKDDVIRYRGLPDQATGHQCGMTLTRRGNRITTAEDGCLDDHGRSCTFSGTFKLRRF